MQKENLILVAIGFADTVALNLYMSQQVFPEIRRYCGTRLLKTVLQLPGRGQVIQSDQSTPSDKLDVPVLGIDRYL